MIYTHMGIIVGCVTIDGRYTVELYTSKLDIMDHCFKSDATRLERYSLIKKSLLEFMAAGLNDFGVPRHDAGTLYAYHQQACSLLLILSDHEPQFVPASMSHVYLHHY